MEYNNINRLILGTAQIGMKYGINIKLGQIGNSEALKILERAYEIGIKTIDTAPGYGNAYEIVGSYQNSNQSTTFQVNTKIPKGLPIEKYEPTLSQYLDVLNINHVNTLMLHSYDDYTEQKNALNTLDSFKEKGLIKQSGISVYSNEQFKTVLSDDFIDVIQLPFNIFDNWSIRSELIKQSKARKKEIHIRSIFLQGLIFMNLLSKKRVLKKAKSSLIQLHEIALGSEMDIVELAIRYALSFPEIDKLLLGIDRISQFEINITFFNKGALPLDLRDNISKVLATSCQWTNPINWKGIK